jgi:hypothetical protein
MKGNKAMFELNTMSGDERKKVKVSITIDVEMLIGGEDTDDRYDSVKEMIGDHYDDIVSSLVFGSGVNDIKISSFEEEST